MNSETPNSGSPQPKSALWVLLVMGGLIALIFVGDYLKSSG